MNFERMAKCINFAKIELDKFEKIAVYQIDEDNIVVYLIENTDSSSYAVEGIATFHEVLLLEVIINETIALSDDKILEVSANQLKNVYDIEVEFFPKMWEMKQDK